MSAGNGRTRPSGKNRYAPESAEVIPFERHLQALELSRDEWQQLKELVLENAYGHVLPIPEELAGHEVALLVAEHRRTGRRSALDQAAALLVGSKDSAWLALDKS